MAARRAAVRFQHHTAESGIHVRGLPAIDRFDELVRMMIHHRAAFRAPHAFCHLDAPPDLSIEGDHVAPVT